MIIAIGSKNPTKVSAVERVATKLFSDFEVVSVDVPSNVSEMPMTDEESILGAENRAINAKGDYDYAVGIEGGVQENSKGMFLGAWVAVTNGKEKGMASTGKIQLPEKIARELRQGKELGPVMDELTGIKGIKHTSGTIGLLTNGLINRTDAFEEAILCAFMQLINKEYYQ